MTHNDDRIAEALSADDQRLLASMQEPAFFRMALGLYAGRNAWVIVVLSLVQAVMFFAALWCGWRFFQTDEVLGALKWGLPAATLAIVATQLKMFMMSQLQADRVIAAIRQQVLHMAR